MNLQSKLSVLIIVIEKCYLEIMTLNWANEVYLPKIEFVLSNWSIQLSYQRTIWAITQLSAPRAFNRK